MCDQTETTKRSQALGMVVETLIQALKRQRHVGLCEF